MRKVRHTCTRRPKPPLFPKPTDNRTLSQPCSLFPRNSNCVANQATQTDFAINRKTDKRSIHNESMSDSLRLRAPSQAEACIVLTRRCDRNPAHIPPNHPTKQKVFSVDCKCGYVVRRPLRKSFCSVLQKTLNQTRSHVGFRFQSPGLPVEKTNHGRGFTGWRTVSMPSFRRGDRVRNEGWPTHNPRNNLLLPERQWR